MLLTVMWGLSFSQEGVRRQEEVGVGVGYKHCNRSELYQLGDVHVCIYILTMHHEGGQRLWPRCGLLCEGHHSPDKVCNVGPYLCGVV